MDIEKEIQLLQTALKTALEQEQAIHDQARRIEGALQFAMAMKTGMEVNEKETKDTGMEAESG